jgi:hypothetical protein
LLPVQDRGEIGVAEDGKFRAMRFVSFMVVADERIEFVFTAIRRVYLPIQKCPEWIALHETVEEATDLLGLPNEFPLNCWKNELGLLDGLKRFFDVPTSLIHEMDLRRQFPGSFFGSMGRTVWPKTSNVPKGMAQIDKAQHLAAPGLSKSG